MLTKLLLAIAVIALHGPALGATIEPQSVNTSQWDDAKSKSRAHSPSMIKLQVLLDRAHFSPGEIDGMSGENVDKAVAAYAASQNLEGMSEEL
jgi:peptidoglycan hydrolase-like protein with peptidoglycan-binding domain